MADGLRVVVSLDGQVRDPQAHLLYADDLAAVRGDGIFETLLLRHGRPCLLEAHLARLTHSAKLMDLPEPDLAQWRSAVRVAVDRWVAAGGEEAALRLVYSRGRESDPTGTGVRTATPSKSPAYFGSALVVATAAPVLAGTRLAAAARPRRNRLLGPSTRA